jgi:hypothetical protein
MSRRGKGKGGKWRSDKQQCVCEAYDMPHRLGSGRCDGSMPLIEEGVPRPQLPQPPKREIVPVKPPGFALVCKHCYRELAKDAQARVYRCSNEACKSYGLTHHEISKVITTKREE